MPSVTVAIAGASASDSPFSLNLGGHFAKSLAHNGAHVKVLTREESATKPKIAELKNSGIEIVVVDYAKAETVERALRGVDIVISTLAGPGFANQEPLAAAAKKQGVKLFLPSEWGTSTLDNPESSPLHEKTAFANHLKSLGVPSCLMFTGPFEEVAKFLVGPKDGKIALPDGGKVPIGWTAVDSAAAYIGYVFTHVPISQLQNTILRLESSRASYEEIAKEYQKRDPSVVLENHPLQEYRDRAENDKSFIDWLIVAWNTSDKNLVGTDQEIKESLALYPGFKHTSIFAAL